MHAPSPRPATRLKTSAYNPAEHRTLREKLKSLDAVEAQNAQLQLASEQREKALAELPEFREKRDLAQQWLDEAKYAPNERAEREQVRQRIRTLNYNAEHHQRVSQQLAALQDAPAQYERLQVAERDLENAQTQFNTAQNRLTGLTTHTAQTQQRLTELTTAITRAESTLEEANALEKNIALMRAQRDDLLQQNAALQSQIEHCDALSARTKHRRGKNQIQRARHPHLPRTGHRVWQRRHSGPHHRTGHTRNRRRSQSHFSHA